MINYEIVGPTSPRLRRAGQTMLVLHGWGTSLAEWMPFSDSFKSKYRIILVDLPGFGGTTRPSDDWGIYEYFDFTRRFLQSLKIKEAIVMGHSFGGRITVLLAARTNLVKKLILVDAAGMELKSIKARMYKSVSWVFKWLPQEVKNKLGSRDYRQAGDMRKTFVKIINQSLRNELIKIKAPTLIIWGEKDKESSLAEAKMMHLGIKNSILRIVWGGDHWPHVSNLNKLVEILEEEGI